MPNIFKENSIFEEDGINDMLKTSIFKEDDKSIFEEEKPSIFELDSYNDDNCINDDDYFDDDDFIDDDDCDLDCNYDPDYDVRLSESESIFKKESSADEINPMFETSQTTDFGLAGVIKLKNYDSASSSSNIQKSIFKNNNIERLSEDEIDQIKQDIGKIIHLIELFEN